MTRMISRPAATLVLALPSLLLGAAAMSGCGLLDVSDPTAVEESELANPTGADLLRRAALRRLFSAAGNGAVAAGMLADEFLSDPSADLVQAGIVGPEEMLDRRDAPENDSNLTNYYTDWSKARAQATAASDKLRVYAPPAVRGSHIGQMFAVRGYATLRLAEDYCPGFPLNETVDGRFTPGAPVSTAEAFERALAEFDSALAYAGDSARSADLARVGRARALLGLGRLADAAEAATSVSTAYVWSAEFTFDEGNSLMFGRWGSLERSVADREGGNGLDFVSAADPRVTTTPLGTANDGATGIYGIGKYPAEDAPLALLSGLEARLIEAEAALQEGGDWLGILNELRRTAITPALPDTTDPGTAEARVDLLFRERAFWLFATGVRLADLRRLVRQYGRDSESVFPTGPYRLGNTYADVTNLPFPAGEEAVRNPAVVGCTSR